MLLVHCLIGQNCMRLLEPRARQSAVQPSRIPVTPLDCRSIYFSDLHAGQFVTCPALLISASTRRTLPLTPVYVYSRKWRFSPGWSHVIPTSLISENLHQPCRAYVRATGCGRAEWRLRPYRRAGSAPGTPVASRAVIRGVSGAGQAGHGLGAVPRARSASRSASGVPGSADQSTSCCSGEPA